MIRIEHHEAGCAPCLDVKKSMIAQKIKTNSKAMAKKIVNSIMSGIASASLAKASMNVRFAKSPVFKHELKTQFGENYNNIIQIVKNLPAKILLANYNAIKNRLGGDTISHDELIRKASREGDCEYELRNFLEKNGMLKGNLRKLRYVTDIAKIDFSPNEVEIDNNKFGSLTLTEFRNIVRQRHKEKNLAQKGAYAALAL